MSAYASVSEVEFRHEQTRAKVQCGSRNGRNGGNRRRAQCGHRRGDRASGSRRRDSSGGIPETLGGVEPLPVHVEPAAERQIEIADEWWQVNRTAVPKAIREDFQ